jgi:hypothetical protein
MRPQIDPSTSNIVEHDLVASPCIAAPGRISVARAHWAQAAGGNLRWTK